MWTMKSPNKREDCRMRRQPEREQLNRLIVKALGQAFVMEAKGGLGYPPFSETHSASAQPVAREHWEPATWSPGRYHGWTLTN
jgi:hypothetical protein